MPVTLDSIRQQYPQYANVDDRTLLEGLHSKFYPQLDFDDFAQRVGSPIRKISTASADAAQPPALPEQSRDLPDYIKGGADALASGFSHAVVAPVVGGVAGLGARAAALARGQDTAAAAQGAHDWVDKNLVYHTQTPVGKDISSAVSGAGAAMLKPFEGAAENIERGAENLVPGARQGIETASGVVNDVAGITPAIAAVRAASTAPAALARATGELPNPVVAAQQAGFKFRPSDIAARNPTATSLPGSTRETITASPQQTAAFQRHNVALATKLGGDEIGLQDATKILPEHIEAAARAPGAVYDATGQAIGTVDGVHPSTLANLRAVAADQTPQGAVSAPVRAQLNRIIEGLQSGQYQGPQLIKDISYLRDKGGQGGFYAAEALESEMENQLKGQPETLANFQAARTQFAKIHDVQDSLRGDLIDPQALLARSALRRDTGSPLTGNLALIANAANEGPGIVRMPSATADQSPVAGSFTKTIANAAGNAISRVPGMDIGAPGVQARLAAAAPRPGPLPNPAGLSRTAAPAPPVMGRPPGAVGAEPRQLGLELAPGAPPAPAFDLAPPEGEAFGPAQRGMTLPQGRGPIDLSKQILRQIRLRNGELPGTLDNGG